ncbi:MAG: hypothetical protein ACE5JR_02690 [Gemmatimonadota bacterium]
MNRYLDRGFLSLLVFSFALGIGGCGGDPAGPSGEFDAVGVAQSLDGVRGNLDDDSDMIISLDLVGSALQQQTGTPSLVGGDLSRPGFAASIAPARTLLSAGSASAPIFPSNLLGKTFVWSAAEDSYVIDETLTGAPANGVRFLLYAINPITRRPAVPLVVVGRADLMDESSAESTRLAVQAVVGEQTLIDYFVEASFTQTQQTVSVNLDALGFISDGSVRLDFDLSESVGLSDAAQTFTISLLHSLEVAAEDVAVTLSVNGEFDLVTEVPVSLAFTLTVREGPNTLVFTGEATDVAIDGSLAYNGEVVVLASGDPDNPTFTRADGSELSAADAQALRDIFNTVGEVFDFAEEILDPLGDLL